MHKKHVTGDDGRPSFVDCSLELENLSVIRDADGLRWVILVNETSLVADLYFETNILAEEAAKELEESIDFDCLRRALNETQPAPQDLIASLSFIAACRKIHESGVAKRQCEIVAEMIATGLATAAGNA